MKQPILIIGANLTGLAVALALSHLNQPSIIIERKPKLVADNQNDGRAIALSYGSKQIFEEIGLWNQLRKFAGEINQIRVTDQLSPLFLHFNNNSTLGYLVESDDIVRVLFEKSKIDPNIKIMENTTYNLLENNHDFAKVELITVEGNSLKKEVITTPVVVGADGKHSELRKTCKIKHYHHNYNQTAIVCKVWHEFSHDQIAQEMFLPAGPFAILPLKNSQNSGIVWTESKETAKAMMGLEKEKFEYFLAQKFTDYLGQVKLVSKVVSYPLELLLAEKYYHNRVILVGDAAHAIHPLAGQGFNLAVRDIMAIVEIYKKYENLGLGFGCNQSMQAYQQMRFADNISMAIIMDAFNKIFSNDVVPINLLRKIGLFAVNHTPPLKNFFMNYAMAKKDTKNE